MIEQLNFPNTAVKADGQMIIAQSPSVDALPSSATVVDQVGHNNVVLTADLNDSYRLGMYQYTTIRNRWQMVLPYEVICSELFGISTMYVCLPNDGDNLLPIGDTGQALLTVTRNGVSISNYDRTNTGLALQLPAVRGDVYGILCASPITAATVIPAGIADAPFDSSPYVRTNGMWDTLQDHLNEGEFTGS
jgi:hypothetical protein